MNMTRTRLLCAVSCLAVATVLMGAPPLMAQDDCKAMEKMVANAFSQIHTIPTHVYSTTTIGGKAFSSEMIYAGGSMYMKMNGKWTMAGSIKDMEQVEKKAQQNTNSKDTCRYVREEPVNGEMGALYSSHSETPKGNLDMQTWVSKSSGRMLRQDIDSGAAVISTRYEYRDVIAPL